MPLDVKLEQIRKLNPEREFWEPMWADYRLAYEGGARFLQAAGQSATRRTDPSATAVVSTQFSGGRTRRFLRQLEGEPDPVYAAVLERAFYIGWLPAILDYHRHWLFSQPPQIRPAEGEEPPEWFEEFSHDCTGAGESLIDFYKELFLDVLLCRRAGSFVTSKQDEPNRIVLQAYRPENILDWQRDETGELEWVTLCRKEERREFPEERKTYEVYTFADRDAWYSWDIATADGVSELQPLAEKELGINRVPFVMVEIPHGLWPTDKLFSPQIDLFNRTVRLANAQLLACILQPYIVSNDNTAESRILGESVLMRLRPSDGTGNGAEDFGWKHPDVGPLAFVAEQIDRTRDEMYRIVHQMALAVDSKSIGAIARSGASKIEDRKASEIILAALGGYVRDAIIRTLTLVSLIHGDKTVWTCDGFDNFQISTLDEELQIAALAGTMNFKSPTARKRLELKILNRLLDHEDETTMTVIEKETDEAYEQEEQQRQEQQEQPPVATPMGPPGDETPEEDEQPAEAQA